ncbi:MAG: hypothetical protein COB36_11910 [Alphaproteobacteria bacterium]|nr:MAG: hypothetical protein COB36_11910 [Alphaproteobacteria bacterium]
MADHKDNDAVLTSDTSHSFPKENVVVGKHYPALDGLRGFAVLMVIFFHSANFAYTMAGVQLSGVLSYYYTFTLLGETGVDLFFVLSGFLITGILIDTCNVKNTLKTFYIRRGLRIFPLYYAVFLIILGILVFFPGGDDALSKITLHFLYLQNYTPTYNFDIFMYMNHTWSLAVEEQFYLFWPVLFLFFYKQSPRKALFLCLNLIIVSWLFRWFLTDFEQHKLAYTTLFSRMDELCMGALLSVCFACYRERLAQYADILGYIMFAMVLLLFGSLLVYGRVTDPQIVMIESGLIYCAIFYTALLAHLLLSDGTSRLQKFFSISLLGKMGRISYGMYVFHVPIMLLMGKYLYDYQLGFIINQMILLGGGSVITFIIASLSYRYFEQPILKLKHKYAYES